MLCLMFVFLSVRICYICMYDYVCQSVRNIFVCISSLSVLVCMELLYLNVFLFQVFLKERSDNN